MMNITASILYWVLYIGLQITGIDKADVGTTLNWVNSNSQDSTMEISFTIADKPTKDYCLIHASIRESFGQTDTEPYQETLVAGCTIKKNGLQLVTLATLSGDSLYSYSKGDIPFMLNLLDMSEKNILSQKKNPTQKLAFSMDPNEILSLKNVVDNRDSSYTCTFVSPDKTVTVTLKPNYADSQDRFSTCNISITMEGILSLKLLSVQENY